MKLQNAKFLWLWSPCDSSLRKMTNGRIWMLGSKLMVVTIIWGLNCFIKSVSVIVIIVIVAPFLCFWSVYLTQSCDDISPWTFWHNLFHGVLSFNIQNAIIGVWSFIIIFTYKNNCCLNIRHLPLNNSTCGWVFNRWPKTIHRSCHNN